MTEKSRENPYPEQPHPVGRLEYPLDARGYRHVEALRRRSMLDGPEPYLIYDMPRIVGGGDVVNLGHARGGSAFIMAKSLKRHGLPGKVLSVDCYGPVEKVSDGQVKSNLAELERRNRLQLDYRVDFRNATTAAVGEECLRNGERFKFVFIDADHSYVGVLNDFKVWSPLVEVGGYIGFHDCNQDHTYKVLTEELIDSPVWKERTDLHVYRIRVFERVLP